MNSKAGTRISQAELLILLCFFLSGLAALVYQTVWARLFSVSFGTSELAIATVLAAYMAGLAVGSAIAGRIADRIKSPVLFYALLEAGIAAFALAVPWFIGLAGMLYVTLVGGQPELPQSLQTGQLLYYLFATSLIILVPTALMGATLPVLAHHLIRTDEQIGPRIGGLYALNTLGAVAGVLLGSFVLLPSLGLSATTWIAVSINGAVFGLAVLASRTVMGVGEPVRAAAALNPAGGSSTRLDSTGRLLVSVMLLSGAVSFVYEVFWTRLLGHVLGSSIYAFAIMLATFLSGIVLGSAIAGRLASGRKQALAALGICQILIGVTSIFAYLMMNKLQPGTVTPLLQFGFSSLAMLPTTLFIGATFPLAVRAAAVDQTQIGRVSAFIYAGNTLGAIVGAVAAGFLLLPSLRFAGTLTMGVALNLLMAGAIWVKLQPGWKPAFTTALLLATWVGFYQPPRPALVLEQAAPGFRSESQGREFYAVGRASTVLLNETRGYYDLRTNGLPEAQIAFAGSHPTLDHQKWLGLMGSLARPDASDLLVVGLGGGVSLEGVPPTVERVDVVELEQRVVDANREMSAHRRLDPLKDTRVRIAVNDARNALKLTSRQYDLIVSQPSHPWTAGASHLFSREFVTQAKRHLNEGGVFVQWMNTEFLTPALLGSLAATLQGEFKYVRIYKPSAQTLKFIASDEPLDIEQQLLRTGRPLVDAPNHYALQGIRGPLDIISSLVLDEQGVSAIARGMPAVTDDRNLMSTHSKSQANGMLEAEFTDLVAAHDPLLDEQHWLRQTLSGADLVAIAQRLILTGQAPRARILAENLEGMPQQYIVNAMLQQTEQRGDLAYQSLLTAVSVDPSNQQAHFLLIEPQLEFMLSGGSAVDGSAASLADLGSELRALVQLNADLAAGDFSRAAELDATLAAVDTSALWFSHVLTTRALLRTKLHEVGVPGQLDAALEMVDHAMLLKSTPSRYQLRARIALRLQAAPPFLESAIQVGAATSAYLLQLERTGQEIDSETKQRLTQSIQVLHVALGAGFMSNYWPGRVEWARAEMDQLLQRLKQ